MIYGFDTTDEHAATAALLVYVTWRSRDRQRFKITPDVWSQVERFTKASAKRAATIPEFLEQMKRRMLAGTLSPAAMAVGLRGEIPTLVTGSGNLIEIGTQADQREFMASVIEGADQKAVIRRLYRETAWAVLLVRDRLEREKPLEGVAEKIIERETV